MYNVDVENVIGAEKLESRSREKYGFVGTVLVDPICLWITRIKNAWATEQVADDRRVAFGNLNLKNVDTLGIRPKRHRKALETSQ
jgi:hypothetical protein